MINAFKLYKFLRVKISPIFPLKQWQIYGWSKNELLKETINSANDTDDDKCPFFNIESITVSEVLPKENIDKLHLCLQKIQFLHQDEKAFNKPFEKIDGWDAFQNIDRWTLLGNFQINESSILFKYASHLSFSISGLTDSFYRLDIEIYPNKNISDNLSALAISHMKDISFLSGTESRKWYQFRAVCEGSKSGSIYKRKIINDVIEDIKWNVLKELNKSIGEMLFTSSKQIAPSLTCIITNVYANKNVNFWRSVDVVNFRCDFLPKYNGCISWSTALNPYYIYSLKDNDYNHYMSSEISKFTNEYLVIIAVCHLTRNKIRDFSKAFSKINRKKALKLLKLKTNFDNNVFFESRVLNEYNYNSSEDFIGLFRVPLNSKPILQSLYEELNSTVYKTKELYQNIKTLYENNISFINTTVTYKIQRKSVCFTIISAIVAIISLIIAIKANEEVVLFIKCIKVKLFEFLNIIF